MDRFANYFERFQTLMGNAKSCVELYHGPDDEVAPDEYADLFRWMWVASVSALDKLVHDLAREGMLIIFEERFANAHKRFVMFYLEVCKKKMELPSESSKFKQWILEQHRTKSFQTMRNIADALALILPELSQIPEDKNNKGAKTKRSRTLAQRILELMPDDFSSLTWEDLHDAFDAMITRRNQIVHEGDYQTRRFDERQTVTKAEAEKTWKYMNGVGKAVYQMVQDHFSADGGDE